MLCRIATINFVFMSAIIFTEQNFAPNETGIVGLRIYDSIKEIERRFDEKYTRVTFDTEASC